MAESKPSKDDEKKGGALPLLSSGPSGAGNLPSFKSSLSKKKPPLKGSGKDAKIGGAVVPTWGAVGADNLTGAPMFRGAAAMAGKKSLMGRLKALKTKDMAFIAAGIGVLVMAPLAEYLISDGEGGSPTMSQGFNRTGGFFAEPQDLYEAGLEGIAPGGLMGRDTDVITPLNVRDPSSLIMGPGGMQEEKPAPSTLIPEIKRDAPKDDTDWKKIIDSAKDGAKEVTKRVKLPRPNAKLAGALSGLKGLAGGGSTRASLSLSAPRTPGAQSPSGAGSRLTRSQAIPGFRSTGGRTLSGSGGNASGGFGRSSNPGGTTGQSASATGGINGGGTGTGFGRPNGDGAPTKNPGGSSTKDNKTLGENLAFLRAKMNLEKSIDLKWAKKRYNELERKKMLEQMAAQTAQQVLLKILDRLLKGKEAGKGGGGGGSGGGGKGDQGKKDEDARKGGTNFPSGNQKPSGTEVNSEVQDATSGAAEGTKGVGNIGEGTKALGATHRSLDGLVADLTPDSTPGGAFLKAAQDASAAIKTDLDKFREQQAAYQEETEKAVAAVEKYKTPVANQGKNIAAIKERKGELDAALGALKHAPNQQAGVDPSKYDVSYTGGGEGGSALGNIEPKV
ncbi:MAG: hypothetical protein COB53_11150, partial [Elusimicrobia bacterium]